MEPRVFIDLGSQIPMTSMRGRIRIRIEMKRWIRIRIEVKSRIHRITVMRIPHPGVKDADLLVWLNYIMTRKSLIRCRAVHNLKILPNDNLKMSFVSSPYYILHIDIFISEEEPSNRS